MAYSEDDADIDAAAPGPPHRLSDDLARQQRRLNLQPFADASGFFAAALSIYMYIRRPVPTVPTSWLQSYQASPGPHAYKGLPLALPSSYPAICSSP